jgi:hypothetical protein
MSGPAYQFHRTGTKRFRIKKRRLRLLCHLSKIRVPHTTGMPQIPSVPPQSAKSQVNAPWPPLTLRVSSSVARRWE